MKATSYADITPLDPEWTWDGFIPDNELLVIAGARGSGKGILFADIIARLTNGEPMPGQPDGRPPRNVILATNEDDPNTAMAWRLRAAHADLTRVFDATQGFVLPDTIDSVRSLCADVGNVGLIHIDPLADVSSISLRSGEKKIREQLMNPMRFELAQRVPCTVSTVVHKTKSGRTIGAGAIEDAARQVLSVTRLDKDKSIRLLEVTKTNMGSDEIPPVAYTVVGSNWRDAHVEYIDLPEAPIAELGTPDRILALLREGKPMESRAITSELNKRGKVVKDGAVRTAVSRLAKTGDVVHALDKDGNERYGFWTVPEFALTLAEVA